MSRSLSSEGQVEYIVLEGLVPKVVVATYEENTLRNIKDLCYSFRTAAGAGTTS